MREVRGGKSKKGDDEKRMRNDSVELREGADDRTVPLCKAESGGKRRRENEMFASDCLATTKRESHGKDEQSTRIGGLGMYDDAADALHKSRRRCLNLNICVTY
jgi:hypothetical protein